MANVVFVVFSEWVSGGLKVYAICRNRKAANMVRVRVAKGKQTLPNGSVKYFNGGLPNPYACEIRVVSVQVDVLYPNGLDERKLSEFSGNSNEKEIIS